METKVMSELESKVDVIKKQIADFIKLCFDTSESENKLTSKYLSNTLEYRVRVKLTEILRQERTIPNATALKMSADGIYNIYNAYLDLISYINMSISYTPNKLEFLAFAQISVSAFAHLLENADEDVKQICGDIEADLINFTLSAAEQGQLKEGSSKLRLKSKGGYGHALVQIGDVESVIDKANDTLNEAQFRTQFNRIIEMKNNIDKGLKE